jgi:hypothetical protein
MPPVTRAAPVSTKAVSTGASSRAAVGGDLVDRASIEGLVALAAEVATAAGNLTVPRGVDPDRVADHVMACRGAGRSAVR